MTSINTDEIQTFLDLAFGSKPDDQYILLWEKADQKRSAWFRDIDQAGQFAAAHNVNLYAGVALSPQDYGPHNRCKGEHTTGLVALCSDLDVLGPAHQCKTLPPTVGDALSILPPEFPPSVTIDSGHGAQVWWVFKEPLIFDDEGDRARAQGLTRAWDHYLRTRAAARGWGLDAVHDLARVLRLPGTINRKPGLPDVAARIIATDAMRYNPSDFAEILERYGIPVLTPSASKPNLELHTTSPEPGKDGGHPRVNPYFLVTTAIEKVKNGAKRNDTGLWLLCQLRDDRYTPAQAAEFGTQYVSAVSGIKDDPYSHSEYADTLRSAYSRPPRKQWDDHGELETETGETESTASAEPADVTTAATRPAELNTDDGGVLSAVPAGSAAAFDANHGGALLSVAHGTDNVALAPTRASNAARDGTAEPGKPVMQLRPEVPEAEKKKARAFLKTALDLDIVRVVKHGEADGFHVLHLTDDRKVDLGRTAKFVSELSVRIAVVDGLGSQLPPIKKGAWRKVLDAMLKLLEVEAGFTPEEMVTEWVESFLRGAIQVPSLKEATSQVARAFDAFNHNVKYAEKESIYETGPEGLVILKLRPLYQHVTTLLSAKLSQPDLAVLLARVGFRKCSTFTGPTWMGERLRLQRVWIAGAENFHIRDTTQRLYESDGPRYAPEPPAPRSRNGGPVGRK